MSGKEEVDNKNKMGEEFSPTAENLQDLENQNDPKTSSLSVEKSIDEEKETRKVVESEPGAVHVSGPASAKEKEKMKNEEGDMDSGIVASNTRVHPLEEPLPEEVLRPGAVSIGGIGSSATDAQNTVARDNESERGRDVETGLVRGEDPVHQVTAELAEPEALNPTVSAEEVKPKKGNSGSSTKTLLLWVLPLVAIVAAAIAIGVYFASKDDDNQETKESGQGSSWVPRGSFLYGEAAQDNDGSQIQLSHDGNILAFTAPFHSTPDAPLSGHARIFSWDEQVSDWVQMGQSINGPEAGTFGGGNFHMSKDGKVVAFSTVLFNERRGRVTTYTWDEDLSDWKQLGSNIDGSESGVMLGADAVLNSDGTVLAITSSYANRGLPYGPGGVNVFDWNSETNDWVQRGEEIGARRENEGLGLSVSLSNDGNTIAFAVTNGGGDDFESSTGQTRVYSWDGTGWSQMGSDLEGSSRAPEGVYLSADGRTLSYASADVHCSKAFCDGGGLHVMIWDEEKKDWILKGESVYKDVPERFATALSDDGNRIISSSLANEVTSVAVHDWVAANNTWALVQAFEGKEADGFGFDVAISGNSETIAFSSLFLTFSNETHTLESIGRVEVYGMEE